MRTYTPAQLARIDALIARIEWLRAAKRMDELARRAAQSDNALLRLQAGE